MTTIQQLEHFVQAGQAAQSAVDRAIARADLLAKVHRCRTAIDLLKRRHTDELSRAALDLKSAHDELVAFTRAQGRAPA